MADQDGTDDQRRSTEEESAITDPNTKLGEAAPGTPFALVAMSYLAILAGVCAVLAFSGWVLSS